MHDKEHDAMGDSFVVPLYALEDTHRLAASIADALEVNDLLALDGPLGSGKTTFISSLVDALAGNERHDANQVSSPTYTVCQEYAVESEGHAIRSVVHLDAYRLNTPEDLESIGLDAYRCQRGCVICVEWAARIDESLHGDKWHLAFGYCGENEDGGVLREVEIQLPKGRSLQRGSENPVQRSTQVEKGQCPTCRAAIRTDDDHAPFCSLRCRMADLNAWFDGEYRISRNVDPF